MDGGNRGASMVPARTNWTRGEWHQLSNTASQRLRFSQHAKPQMDEGQLTQLSEWPATLLGRGVLVSRNRNVTTHKLQPDADLSLPPIWLFAPFRERQDAHPQEVTTVARASTNCHLQPGDDGAKLLIEQRVPHFRGCSGETLDEALCNCK